LLRAANGTWPLYVPPKVDLSFEGHGVLIVAKETVNDTKPLCLGLGETQNKVRGKTMHNLLFCAWREWQITMDGMNWMAT
jgi:hypothetical protein